VEVQRTLQERSDERGREVESAVAALHSLTSQSNQMVEEGHKLRQARDQLVQERDQLRLERDQIVQERDQLGLESNQLVQERDLLVQERDQLRQEKDQVVQKCDQLAQERDLLIQEKVQFVQERDLVVQERDLVVQERDLLVQERDQLRQEKDQVVHECDQLRMNNNDLASHHQNLSEQFESLQQEYNSLCNQLRQHSLLEEMSRNNGSLSAALEQLIRERQQWADDCNASNAECERLKNDLQQVNKQHQNTFQALMHVFPKDIYHARRPDLDSITDVNKLLEHFINNGINEGVSLDYATLHNEIVTQATEVNKTLQAKLNELEIFVCDSSKRLSFIHDLFVRISIEGSVK
jgi:chromosome segregation ATPase